MKKLKIFIGMAVIAGLTTSPHFAAAGEGEGLKAPQEEITIEGKKPARFNHQTHLAINISCGQCHHDTEHQPLSETDIAALMNGKQLQCGSCHNETFANEQLNSKKLIFHARCKECHKNGFNDKQGPTKCTACHVKKKG